MKYRRILFSAGTLMAVTEAAKQLILTFAVNGGRYEWWYFPFQLCDMAMYLCLLLPLTREDSPGEAALLTFLSTYTLLGGAMAFCDTSGMHYSLPVLTVHSFGWHVLLILLGLFSGRVLLRKVSMDWGSFGRATVIFGAACGMALLLDVTLDRLGPINMFYINPHYPMEQVVFRDIAARVGNGAAILLYAGLIPAGAAALRGLWNFAKVAKVFEKSS